MQKNCILKLYACRISFNNTSSIFDELTSQDADLIGDVDIGADITGMSNTI